ncbi:alpha/beta fold hydrolase [Leptobacterium sp. I13]|uniref:alpha/beta fold hydrolase n=1 Tax=Leptobacterium meishanense TaxID=3128904 RepID=UPI0030EDBE40
MFLQYKEIPVFYADTGSGDTVVLLHGFLENNTMWNAFTPKLSKQNRVISIDLLGHGNTGCLGHVHTMEMMAEVVHAVLNHLEITHATFIGHSMGGYVSLAFAELFPENIIGLLLMNSTFEPDSEERKQNRDRAIAAVRQNHTSFVNMSITNLFYSKNRKLFPEGIKLIKKEALKTPLQGIIAALEGMKVRRDRTWVLKNFPYKKAMILSKNDPILKFDDLYEKAQKINLECIILPNGHMSHVENKNAVLQHLQNFINK